MDNTEETRIISFCTGYGGLELGLRLCSEAIRTICYVEIEAFACANLAAKIEEGKLDAAPVWTDIKTFPAQAFSGKVHGIIGGYPCQPFSHAGQRQGTTDPRHLWPYIEKHIRTIRPLWCFFENVSGHLSLGFEEVAQSLRDMGYSVEAGLFTAAEVGAPHKRERLFILAYTRSDIQRRLTGSIQNSAKTGISNTGQPRTQWDNTGNESELGNANSQHGGAHAEGRDDNAETRSAGEELADSEATERRRLSEKHTGRGIEEVGGSGRSELANSNRAGCEEQCGSEPIRQEHSAVECGGYRWPARPEQAQYEWEEPRTV